MTCLKKAMSRLEVIILKSRFQPFSAVEMRFSLFSGVTQSRLVDSYRSFETLYQSHLKGEDGTERLFRNVGN